MRDTFVETLMGLAGENRNNELITGDMGFGVLKPFWETYPGQFTNAGIAEQNMTGVATGMALEGKTVFTYSIGNFPTLRCLEQIRNDCTYHNANVKIVCVGGGFEYGPLGMSHHTTEDIAVMRALPNMVVCAPGDPVETREITKLIAKHKGTCYLRLGRGGGRTFHKSLTGLKLGEAVPIEELKENTKVAIFSTGGILDEAFDAKEGLNNKGVQTALYSFPTVKPIDKETILKVANSVDLIVTVEEHNVMGGFGSSVAEIMAGNKTKAYLKIMGISDAYTSVAGSQKYLRKCCGIDWESIIGKILDIIK